MNVQQVKHAPGLFFGLAQSQEQLITLEFLFALLEGLESLDEIAQFAQADAAFFLEPVLALDEDVEFFVLRQEFDAHLRTGTVPGQL